MALFVSDVLLKRVDVTTMKGTDFGADFRRRVAVGFQDIRWFPDNVLVEKVSNYYE
jgi:hypothetical protein